METERGTIILELWNETPNTTKNFVSLIQSGFYNGLTFHRIIPDFVAQGGCPTGNGTGGPGYAIPCETSAPKQVHDVGVISMAHAGRDTGGSQFFLVHTREQTKHLDGKHTVFGKITEGVDVMFALKKGDKMIKVEMLEVDPAIEAHELKKLSARR
jgi:peptidyl-prolyl cis-trans isomerase B (cyclophilin B)